MALQSCILYTGNSFTQDKPCEGADQAFCNFQTLIKPGGCFTSGCHAEWQDYDSADDYVTAGVMVKGSAGGSLIFTKLTGAGSGGNMPLGSYPDLSSSSISKIGDYIDSL
jgi:hypothetical protein